MKIDVSQLKQDTTIEITGSETWLNDIYKTFDCEAPAGAEKPLITGSVKVEVTNPTYVRISGDIAYKPFLDCSRCALPISWQMNETLDIYLLREKPTFEEEVELDEAELDEYYMEDNKTFDLEVALNDALQTARPTQTVITDDSGNCLPCGKKVDADLPAATTLKGKVDPTNPFAALKDLKLKH